MARETASCCALPVALADADADADAQTDEEKAVVGILNKFFIGRMTNNLQREILKPGYANQALKLSWSRMETTHSNSSLTSSTLETRRP
jgi:hypothetical protein